MPISDFIKPEHLRGWQHVAAKRGAASVEEFAQQQFDNLGAQFEGERDADDASAHQRLFDLARRLPDEDRHELQDTILEKAAARGLLPEEGDSINA